MAKAEKTLEAVFRTPVPANLKWRQIEALFRSLGAEVEEGDGSRVTVLLNGTAAYFHRPHPSPDAGRNLVRSVRRFLEKAGVTP